MSKKVAVIGAGTAGVLAISHFNKWMKDCELELYYDSNIKPQPVGEGSTPTLPNCLWQNLEFTFDDLEKVDGIIKYGIYHVAIGEAKYKKEHGNADGRIFELIADSDGLGIKRINFYASLNGPCVERSTKGLFKSTATRKVVVRLDAFKVTKFLNSSNEVMYNTIKENVLNAIIEINNTGQ